MGTPGAIIQARLTSRRFPEKAFAIINGETIISRIVHKLNKCRTIEKKVLAFPDNTDNLDLYRVEAWHDIKTFRGSENDVLGRIIGAAEKYEIDPVVRVCADSPFILSWLIDYAIELFKVSQVDYLFSTGFPKGQNVEVITLDALKKSHEKANDEEKEHVTLYIQHYPKGFRSASFGVDFVVDTEKDLKELQTIAKFYD